MRLSCDSMSPRLAVVLRVPKLRPFLASSRNSEPSGPYCMYKVRPIIISPAYEEYVIEIERPVVDLFAGECPFLGCCGL